MSQPNVLVLTDDAKFAQELLARWQQERIIPTFSVAGNDVLIGASAPECDLAVVGRIPNIRLNPVLKALDASTRTTICLCDSAQISALRATFPRITFLAENAAWGDILVTISVEVLRRVEALGRAKKAEQSLSRFQHEASLGRYMLESRHSLNNALTSVLGNAELLLLDPSKFSPEVRDQLETIHAMSLKMHELFYRFSSLENERQFVEKASQGETGGWVSNAAAGD